MCLLHQIVPSIAGQLHELCDEALLRRAVRLRCNHVANSFVERMHLLRRQVDGYLEEIPQNFVDEWFLLASLLHHKVSPALLCDLRECIARHVLHTFMRFMHELEVFVHDRLQELPVCLEESWVLTDNVHDI